MTPVGVADAVEGFKYGVSQFSANRLGTFKAPYLEQKVSLGRTMSLFRSIGDLGTLTLFYDLGSHV